MNSHDLSAENMMSSLPQVLQNDPNLAALASSIAQTLEKRLDEIHRVSIYSRIDDLSEDLLDILAYDFKIDWWDGNYTVEEKRKTLKESWNVHRRLGTTAAVKTAISAIYPDTLVSEWWEYGGEPYHFKLMINLAFDNVDPVRHQRVMEKVNYYKNLRSVLDKVEYYETGASVKQYFGAAFLGCSIVDSATAVEY